MNIIAPYKQISEYILAKTKHPISLSFVNDKEIKISYTKKIFTKEVGIGINLKIQKVADAEILISYQAPLGLDIVIAGAISFLTQKLPALEDSIYLVEDHMICIRINKIEKMQPMTNNITLQDITFNESEASIEFFLKY